MNRVVDASVACKWFLAEELSDAARDLAGEGTTLHAPDLILVECANVAWRHVTAQSIPLAQAEALLDALPRWFEILTPAAELYDRAFRIAHALRHPVYDCVYLGLAEREEMRLVTADKAFASRVRDSRWAHLVEGLGASALRAEPRTPPAREA